MHTLHTYIQETDFELPTYMHTYLMRMMTERSTADDDMTRARDTT